MFLALLKKDVALLLRARAELVSVFGFSLLLVTVASFSFRRLGAPAQEMISNTAGILWVLFLFAGVIVLNNSFAGERRSGALQALLRMTEKPGQVYLSKCLVNCLSLALLQIFIIVSHALLYGADVMAHVPLLAALAVAGAIGVSASGTLLAAMAAAVPAREVLLPILLYPLLLPLIAGCVAISREVLLYGAIEHSSVWLTMVLGYDVVALVLGWVLFEFAANP